jgi:hypothetical protein
MRFIPMFAATATLLLTLSGCTSTDAPDAEATSSSTTPTSTPNTPRSTAAVECPPTPIDVTISYELATDASGGVTINAASNLPDGAVLNSSFFIENGFFAQDEGVLRGGKITFGPFSDKGTPLQGTYDMSITLPIARNQPEEIQTCIGKAGENLTGSLVSTDEISGDRFASIDVSVAVD